MIHYHGTPLTPRTALHTMAGKSFCVSFADPRDAETCLQIGQSVMWDNGAYSLYTQGEKVDWNSYYKWLEPKLGPPHWAAIPDVIDGGEEENDKLVEQWPHGDFGAPVWHMDEPIERLLRLTDNWPKVSFGSSGAYWEIGTEQWERRCDEAFNAITRRGPIPWIHMMRGLSLGGKRWPFASADSTNVARNYKDTGVRPEFMARSIDAVQCPVGWTLRGGQDSLAFD